MNVNSAKTCFIVLWGVNALSVVHDWINFALNLLRPDSSGISEFLINYQGGFVRRGLFGEALLSFCHYFACEPRYIIVPLCVASFLAFCCVLFCIINNLRAAYWTLPTFYCLFGADFIRKDYLVLVLIFLAIFLYRKVKNAHLGTAMATLLLVFVLNLHEASFFFAAPLFFLVLFSESDKRLCFLEKMVHCVVLVVMMAILCIEKGNADIVEAISFSWQPFFPDLYPCANGNSISALACGTKEAIKYHLNCNFVYGYFRYIGCVLRPLSVLIVLYLMARVTFSRAWAEQRTFVDKYIYIFTLHFIGLLPMFTILSCDFRRCLFYLTSISFFCLYFFRNEEIFGMNWTLSRKCVGKMHQILSVFPSKYAPYIVLLLFSIPYMSNPLISYGPPVAGMVSKLLKAIGG